MANDSLLCPVCGRTLTRTSKTFRCSQAHSFDIAREGYVNLLTHEGSKPQVLGDTREMLRARRAFLDQGYYRVLADGVCRRVYKHLANRRDRLTRASILDVGCGEGYYLSTLKSYVDRELPQVEVHYFGMDLSKNAVQLAAKRDAQLRTVVADTQRRVLVASGTMQVVLNMFAPRNPAEWARILSRQGMLLVVLPGPDHLLELRTRFNLLGVEHSKEARVIEQLSGQFVLSSRQEIEQLLRLSSEDVIRLVTMTPNYWHIHVDTRKVQASGEPVITRAQFVLLEFRKRREHARKEGSSPRQHKGNSGRVS